MIRRKMALMVKMDQQLVAEVELDEIPGDYTVAFAPNDPRIFNLVDGDNVKVPQLSIMWRHRSFNLLLNQQNELRLNGLELSLLDFDDEQNELTGDSRPPVIRYSLSGHSSLIGPSTSANQATRVGGAFSSNNHEMSLTRNQWYKFEGRLISRTNGVV